MLGKFSWEFNDYAAWLSRCHFAKCVLAYFVKYLITNLGKTRTVNRFF